MYVCICSAVTEKEIVSRVQAGSTSFEQIQYELGVGACCGQCRECACEVIEGACARRLESVSD